MAIPLLALLTTGCAHRNSLQRESLEIPAGDLPIVQQERDPQKRSENPLYLPNRKVLESEFGSNTLQNLISAMHQAMRQKDGIGIAANQLGKNIQVFLIEAKSDNPRYRVLGPVPFSVFLNPRITQTSPERKNFWHGCLSAVGEKRGNVATYAWIDVEANTPDGKPLKVHLEGLAAVIFQHEFRHLLGGTYLDRANFFLEKKNLDQMLDRKEVPFFAPADENLPLLIGDYQLGESLEDYYARRSSNTNGL